MVTVIYALILAVVFLIDLEYHLILDKIIYPAMVIAVIFSFLPHGIGALSALAGGLAGLAVMIIIYKASSGGMGAGDIKLMALIGLMVGFPSVLLMLGLSFILGSLVSIGLLLNKNRELNTQLPFGTFLSVVTIGILLVKVL